MVADFVQSKSVINLLENSNFPCQSRFQIREVCHMIKEPN